LPASHDPRDETVAFFVERFGVDRAVLSTFFLSPGPDDVWAATTDPGSDLQTVRPPGLRAARRMRGGLKPTSTFLRALGPLITASRFEITDQDVLKRLLLGQSEETTRPDGYVALVYRGDVLGCGSVKAGHLRALLPTGQRNELLKTVP